MEQPVTATVSDIASALGITDRAIRKRALQWKSTGDRVQGGGDTFDIDTIQLRAGEAKKIKRYLTRKNSTPITLQSLEEAQNEAAEAERQRQNARAESLAIFSRLPEKKQQPAKAKIAIIAASNSYITSHRLAKKAGQDSFAHEYNLGRIDIAPWVKAEIGQIHPGTLRNWIKTEYELGITGLVDCYGNRKDQGVIETWNKVTGPTGIETAPMADILQALILQHPHIKEKKANEALRGLLPAAPRVNDKTVKRYMDKWKARNMHQFALATNPDDFKNRLQPAFGSRSEGITGPNQLWEIDATPADLLLTDGRYKIIGVCDVGPRRHKYLVTKTERARDNAFAVRRCLLDWGVPYQGTIKTDQGSAYVGDHFPRVLSDLEIHQHICQPFSGDEKPHVERGFRTFSHDLVELMPGYCGHNVAERKAIEARKSFAQRLMTPGETIEISMTSQDLQAICDRWTTVQMDIHHSELGQTPSQVLAQWPHPIHRITDERALDVLLAETVRRGGRLPIIGKKGIRVNGGRYIHPALGVHVGENCRAFQDPADLGRIIVNIKNEQGIWEHLCVAEDPARTDISMQEVAQATRALHSEHKKEIARLTRETKKALKGVDVVDAVLSYREREAAKARGNLSYLPKREIEYTTPALEAARLASITLDGRDPAVEHPPELQAKRAALAAAISRQPQPAEAAPAPRPKVVPLHTPPPPGFQVPDDRRERWLLWNELHQRVLSQDDSLLDEEIRFYTSFKASPTWKSFNRLTPIK